MPEKNLNRFCCLTRSQRGGALLPTTERESKTDKPGAISDKFQTGGVCVVCLKYMASQHSSRLRGMIPPSTLRPSTNSFHYIEVGDETVHPRSHPALVFLRSTSPRDMFGAFNRFIGLEAEPAQQPRSSTADNSFGFQVLRNKDPEVPLEPWFDFIIGINGRLIVRLLSILGRISNLLPN